MVNFLSARAAPGRFVSARPAWGRELHFEAERKREFESSVIEVRPLWIVLGPPQAACRDRGGIATLLAPTTFQSRDART